MRSGDIWLDEDWTDIDGVEYVAPTFGSAGGSGVLWSSRSERGDYGGYNFYFYSPNIRPSNNWNRYQGTSLRCLSTVLDR